MWVSEVLYTSSLSDEPKSVTVVRLPISYFKMSQKFVEGEGKASCDEWVLWRARTDFIELTFPVPAQAPPRLLNEITVLSM